MVRGELLMLRRPGSRRMEEGICGIVGTRRERVVVSIRRVRGCDAWHAGKTELAKLSVVEKVLIMGVIRTWTRRAGLTGFDVSAESEKELVDCGQFFRRANVEGDRARIETRI